MATTATALSMLPEEMEMEVLVRLPAKSILRFSAVCRRWGALLSSNEFCSAWTKIGESRTTEPAAQLLFIPLPPRTDERSIEVRSGDGRRLLTLDGVRTHYRGMALASCRGLTLLGSPLSRRYCVFNGATRAAAKLPPCSPYCQEGKLLFPSSAGLGFDAKTKEYKVVRLFSSSTWAEECFTSTRCEVHTLGRGADGLFRPPSSAVMLPSLVRTALVTATLTKMEPVFADGFLHWYINPSLKSTNPSAHAIITAVPEVLSFSVTDETFSSFLGPPCFNYEDRGRVHLTELDGRLCMVRDLRSNSGLLEIWCYSNGVDRWSLEHSINLAAHQAGTEDLTEQGGLLYDIRVLGGSFGKRKVIFIATSRCKVVAYDPKSGTLKPSFSLQEKRVWFPTLAHVLQKSLCLERALLECIRQTIFCKLNHILN